jgi:hypothetical protein
MRRPVLPGSERPGSHHPADLHEGEGQLDWRAPGERLRAGHQHQPRPQRLRVVLHRGPVLRRVERVRQEELPLRYF